MFEAGRNNGAGLGARRAGRLARVAWWLALAAIATAVMVAFARFHRPGQGFTYTLDFGASLGLPRLPEVGAAPTYIHPQVAGYDGQMYAQLALRPAARDPELARVLDNPPYRARRILMSWVAHACGLGRPWWVLNAQALINLAAWCALGALLLRWFRPGRWPDLLRWGGVMLSAGMLSSVRHALVDGPALLAIAACMASLECGRRRLALATGALAGLTRETAILVGAALAPDRWREPRAWLRALGGCAVVALPLAAWAWHVSALGSSGVYHGGGFANFTWPFAGFLERWVHLAEVLVRRGWLATPGWALLLHLALTVQVVFVVARPRWRDPWWRLGAAHVVLLAGLNTQVWEDFPGAAPRVLLPLMLAFNRLVPDSARWTAVLLAGNLTIFAGFVEMRAPPREVAALGIAAEAGAPVAPGQTGVTLGEGFLVLEGSGADSWRWAVGEARARILNDTGRTLRASIEVGVRSRDGRTMSIAVAGAEVLTIETANTRRVATTREFEIPPGGAEVVFRCGEAPPPPPGDRRAVAVEFSVLRVRVW